MKRLIDAYIECAIWSSVHFEDENDDCGTPLDQVDAELSESARESMANDCADLLSLLEAEGVEWSEDWSEEQFGHDFWLTRNGHGAGFWDRGKGELGRILSQWAKTYGSSDLYVGDDGMIYVS